MTMLLRPVFVVAVSALLSAGCSSGPEPAATPTPTPTTSAAVPTVSPGTPGGAANLVVTAELRAQLGDAFFQATKGSGARRDQVIGPEHVFYGKTAGAEPVFYAMGDTGYTGNLVSQQDGPHVWRKRGSGGWEYLGDTGGDFCGKVPRQLVRVWGQSCP